MRFPVIAASLAPFLLAAAQQGPRTLTSAEMQADLLQLGDALVRLHPGLHRYAKPEEIDEALGAALLACEEGPEPVVDFYRTVSALLALVRCGHTSAVLPELDRLDALSTRGLLPIEVHFAGGGGGRAWIRRALVPAAGLDPGREILALDGLTIAEIRARAFARLSDDGRIETAKERGLEARFAELYALLVDEVGAGEYALQLAGTSEPVRVAGIAWSDFEARRTPAPERPLVKLELQAEDALAVLAVREFGDDAGTPSFTEQLETCFRTLRERKVRGLVLDLRGNGGGRDMYGALLVSYLAREPFGYFERIEVTPEYTGDDFEVVERDGRRLMLSHEGLQVQEPAELRFEGDVAILTDGFTFSTAADVATVAHHLRLATFLGEETGGGYDGNTSGDSERLRLSSSNIVVGVPKWMYTTANLGHAFEGRGVVPDVPVSSTIEDVLAGRDPVLARALEHLRSVRR